MKAEISKRGDNKYAVWVWMVDPSYDPEYITEDNIWYLNHRWVQTGVYSEYKDASQKQKEYTDKPSFYKRKTA